MSNNWPLVALGEVMQLSIDAVPIDPTATYPMTGVYSFGRGLIDREPLQGSNTTYKFLHRLHEDDFVLSMVKGWEGALARVTEFFAGRHLSPHFPTFRTIPDKLEITYLEWYCKQPKVWEALRRKSHGIGARREVIPPDRFLSLEIPLPPLDEQRRIVARIEELAAKVEQARELRRRAVKEVAALAISMPRKIFESDISNGYTVKLKDAVSIMGGGTPSKHILQYWDGDIPWVSPKDMKTFEISDTIDHITDIAIQESSTKLIPQDAVLVVTRSGILKRTIPVVINRVPVTVNQDLKALIPKENLLPEYLRWWFKGNEAKILTDCVKGGTTVQSIIWKKLEGLRITIPPLPEQHRIVAYLDKLQGKVEAVKHQQAGSAVELAALLPSILDRAFKGEL